MDPTQASMLPTAPRVAPACWFRPIVSAFLLACFVLIPFFPAHAQVAVSGVPVATDQSVAASLSNQFGVPVSQAIDQAGDLVFVGRGASAIFFRPAGTNSLTTRLLQVGDPVPGIT